MSNETTIILNEYCQADGRISPLPDYWNQIWEKLPEKQRGGAAWLPPLPLILAALWNSDPLTNFQY